MQIPDLSVNSSISKEGTIRLQIFNMSKEAKRLTQKVNLIGLLLRTDCEVKVMEEETGVIKEVNALYQKNSVIDKFPQLFDMKRSYGETNSLKAMTISNREIDWKIPIQEIPKSNRGLVYNIGQVSRADVMEYLKQLEREKIIRRLRPEERVLFSPVMS